MSREPGIALDKPASVCSMSLPLCSLLNGLNVLFSLYGVNVLFSLCEWPLISASDKRNDAVTRSLVSVAIAYIAGHIFQQDRGKLSKKKKNSFVVAETRALPTNRDFSF